MDPVVLLPLRWAVWAPRCDSAVDPSVLEVRHRLRRRWDRVGRGGDRRQAMEGEEGWEEDRRRVTGEEGEDRRRRWEGWVWVWEHRHLASERRHLVRLFPFIPSLARNAVLTLDFSLPQTGFRPPPGGLPPPGFGAPPSTPGGAPPGMGMGASPAPGTPSAGGGNSKLINGLNPERARMLGLI